MTQLKKEITNISDFNKKVGELLEKIPLYYDENKIWYKWNQKKHGWEITDETDILVAIQEGTNIANISQTIIIQQIINALKIESRKNKPEKLKNTEIQFKEWIVDIETMSMKRATPKHFSFNPIRWSIQGTETETPIMDKLIKEWVGEEETKKIYEWIAYQLLPHYPIHRIAIFNGSGSNGKSTLLSLMKKFLGNNNYTAGDFETIFIRRFGTSILRKKLSVLMPEADFGKLEKTATFKSATGNDDLLMEYKNKTPFTEKSYAKVTMCTNTLPMTLDKTDAFYRRMMVIDFPNRFAEKVKIIDQIPEKEYHNLARKSIKLIKELLQKGKFNNEETLEEKKERYERLSNPMSIFIEEETIESMDEYIPKRDLLTKANKWLYARGLRTLTNREISKVMRDNYQEGWGTTIDQELTKRSERVWLGIGWKKDQIKISEEKIEP